MRFTVNKNFVFLLLFTTSVWSQSKNDSIAIKKLNWATIKLDNGLNYKSIETSLLFNSSQHISVLEINLKKNKYQIRLLASKKGVLQRTSQIAMEHNAIAAINGNFFNVKTQGAVDFVKINDTILAENYKVDSKRRKRTNGFIGVSSNSKTALVKLLDNQNEIDYDFASIMSSGPMLLFDKEMVLFDQNSFSTNRHPRTCIAQKSESVFWLITVDGRNKKAAGMTLLELSWFLKQLGCVSALNMDGGGSTTMFIENKGDKGIVNWPSDHQKYNSQGEREVANCIAIIKK